MVAMRAWLFEYGESHRSGVKMRLTSYGEGVIIHAQAEEEEEQGEPDADCEEHRHISERGELDYGPTAVGLARGVVRLVREV